MGQGGEVDWVPPGAVYLQGIVDGKPVTYDPEAKVWRDEQGNEYVMELVAA